jgi:hypothetical protein
MIMTHVCYNPLEDAIVVTFAALRLKLKSLDLSIGKMAARVSIYML